MDVSRILNAGEIKDTQNRLLPEATLFTNSAGEFAKYYFKNNPWKLTGGGSQKSFRFCIICGNEKLSNEEWSQVLLRMQDISATICKKDSCAKAFPLVPNFVPSKFYLQETAINQRQAKKAEKKEFFEEVAKVTFSIRLETICDSQKQLPPQELATFIDFAQATVNLVFANDLIYFQYQEQHSIPVGKEMRDTPDKYLQDLAEERQRLISVLGLLHSALLAMPKG